MTPKEKAREIVKRWERLFYVKESAEWEDLYKTVAAALAEERKAALEEAAKIVDYYALTANISAGMEQEDGYNEEARMFFHDQHELEGLATKIRSLIGKDSDAS